MDEQFSAEYITFRDTLGRVKLARFFFGYNSCIFFRSQGPFVTRVRWNKTASEKGASDMGLDELKHIFKKTVSTSMLKDKAHIGQAECLAIRAS